MKLDPFTLRAVADSCDEAADHRAQRCGGEHVSCAARIATLADKAAELRSTAIRVELGAAADGASAGGCGMPTGAGSARTDNVSASAHRATADATTPRERTRVGCAYFFFSVCM